MMSTLREYVCDSGHVTKMPSEIGITYCGRCFASWATRHFPILERPPGPGPDPWTRMSLPGGPAAVVTPRPVPSPAEKGGKP